MKAAQVLVMIALVAAGIFVYDTLGADHRSPEGEAVAPPARQAGPRATDDPRPSSTALQGSGWEAFDHRLQAIEDRLDRVEQGLADQAAALRSAATAPSPTGGESPGTWHSETLPDGAAPQFDPKDLAWFRAMKDEVDRIERQQRFAQIVRTQLDRVEVTLTEDQREGVVEITMVYREKVRAVLQEAGKDAQSVSERRDALEELRTAYKREIYGVVPGADGDKIVAHLGRYPGFPAEPTLPRRQ